MNLIEFILSSNNIFYNPINQLLFSMAVAIIFSNIGFILGSLTKSTLISSLIIVIYNLMIPSLGKYDLTNLIANIGSKIFEFNSSFNLFTPKEVSYFPYIIYAFAFLIINIYCYYFLKEKKQIPLIIYEL